MLCAGQRQKWPYDISLNISSIYTKYLYCLIINTSAQ